VSTLSDFSLITLTGILSFAIALAIGPGIISYLYKLKFGQSIRQAGPATHQKKAGTPTMGGIIIIFAFVVATLLMVKQFELVPYALFAVVGFGLIGLLDDYVKVTKRSLGLKARHKLLGQVLIALLVALYALNEPRIGPVLLMPFSQVNIVLADWLYLLIVMFTLLGAVNGVNFADGLDGLAAGATAVAAVAYAVIAYMLGNTELAVFAVAVAGACLGFSWFNSHPAQVIMGDLGSLALGGALGVLAVFTRTELLLPIIGGVFVIEILSVVIQVVYFRLTGGRRFFRMSPIHHHYELAGWAETKVVTRFWLVALIFALLGLLAF